MIFKRPLNQFAEEYAKHAALNFGQALQGIRYIQMQQIPAGLV